MFRRRREKRQEGVKEELLQEETKEKAVGFRGGRRIALSHSEGKGRGFTR